MSNKLEQLKFKVEKILGFGNIQEKLENVLKFEAENLNFFWDH